MRTLIVNATVVDGTGAAPRDRSTVVVQDHHIEDVVQRSAIYYDRADSVVDARDGFVLPGLVNHHAHGLTRGPLMILGQPALSDARVASNLDRLLRQGVTTALNVDGFPTVEDTWAAGRFHPVSVKASTLHTPSHLHWITEGPFSEGGVLEAHRWTVERMLSRGALAIGEAGPGIDPHWTDYVLIPKVVQMLGGHAELELARRIRNHAIAGDREALQDDLKEAGAEDGSLPRFLELHELVGEWSVNALASLREAIDAAHSHGVPLVFHHTPGTYALQIESAELLGARHIAAHSNFQCTSVEDAVGRAVEIRRRGGLVDIMSGDCFGAREFHSTPEITFGMLAAGVVDLISTDYAGGFWDSMLLLVEEAARAGAIAVGEGVRLVTSAPAEAVPGLAPDRGVLAPGKIADVVITEPGRLSRVRHAMISGRLVPMPSNDWS